ncbi:MAG: folylpolyglutamate synthase/dihydrofolate synthase family protein [Candidatus Omnitrophota bacterium]
MIYCKAIRYLESFINYEEISAYPYKESLTLERIKYFLEAIGNPQDSLKCIHVAGSKGKGSTCVFIAYMLREAGFKTGLYTSPHLSDFRERIRILSSIIDPAVKPQDDNQLGQNGNQLNRGMAKMVFEGMISKRELSGLAQRLRPAIDKYNKDSKYGPLSFFEVYTALAFVYFKEKKTDFVVLETGLGGRLDATNVVDSLVSVLTPISYEHMDKLGKTLKKIAAEKAGIIKIQKSVGTGHDLSVISAPQEKEAIEVIRNRCEKTRAKLYEVGRDVVYKEDKKGFGVKGIYGEYPNLKINLIGRHQVMNAVTAIAAVEALQSYGICVSPKCIKNGLYNTIWPGRCEVVSKSPLIVLDGAQNAASMRALKNALAEKFKYKELILVLGVSSDKDIAGICAQLRDFSDEIILTRSNNPRAYNPEKLAGFFSGKHCEVTMTVEEAVKLAKKKCNRQGLILVTGSLFVVAQARSSSFVGFRG